jgi:hypothetical protein
VSTPGLPSPTNLRLRNIKLGSDTGGNLANGVLYSCAGESTDRNNENGEFIGIVIVSCTNAAYSITHSNSMGHRIIGGSISYSKHAVQLAGVIPNGRHRHGDVGHPVRLRAGHLYACF